MCFQIFQTRIGMGAVARHVLPICRESREQSVLENFWEDFEGISQQLPSGHCHTHLFIMYEYCGNRYVSMCFRSLMTTIRGLNNYLPTTARQCVASYSCDARGKKSTAWNSVAAGKGRRSGEKAQKSLMKTHVVAMPAGGRSVRYYSLPEHMSALETYKRLNSLKTGSGLKGEAVKQLRLMDMEKRRDSNYSIPENQDKKEGPGYILQPVLPITNKEYIKYMLFFPILPLILYQIKLSLRHSSCPRLHASACYPASYNHDFLPRSGSE